MLNRVPPPLQNNTRGKKTKIKNMISHLVCYKKRRVTNFILVTTVTRVTCQWNRTDPFPSAPVIPTQAWTRRQTRARYLPIILVFCILNHLLSLFCVPKMTAFQIDFRFYFCNLCYISKYVICIQKCFWGIVFFSICILIGFFRHETNLIVLVLNEMKLISSFFFFNIHNYSYKFW